MAEKTKHTAGEWEWYFSGTAGRWMLGVWANEMRFDHIDLGGPPDQPPNANMRLIAAAPNLLNACESLLAVIDQLPNGHSKERVTSAIFAREAIAKAGVIEVSPKELTAIAKKLRRAVERNTAKTSKSYEEFARKMRRTIGGTP